MRHLFGPMVYASQTLTFADVAIDTQTAVIAGKTYTFQDVLTNVDGNVKIGADTEESIANLVAAINLGAGAGTAYAALTVVNPHVRATSSDATTVVVTSRCDGTIGNFLPTTETLENASWGAVLLAGGTTDFVSLVRAAVARANSSIRQAVINLTDPEGDE